MTEKQINDLADKYPDLQMIKIDGFDSCCLGVVSMQNVQTVLAYDANKIIAKLIKAGMTKDEAEEYFNFNIGCAYMGEGTPAFIYK
jgi:hypothetical protein